MSHLVRAALLLVLFVTAFLFLRSIATSVVSLEIIGLSRTDNARQWAIRPVQNQSAAICAQCHQATNDSRQASAHASVTCENCHGPGKDHIASALNGEEAPMILPDGRDLCLTCHAKIPSRPSQFPQVDPLTHGAPAEGIATACVSCHNPHDPGIPPEIPHPLEGRSDCLACHGPEQWKPLPAYHVDVEAPDACFKCHSPMKER